VASFYKSNCRRKKTNYFCRFNLALFSFSLFLFLTCALAPLPLTSDCWAAANVSLAWNKSFDSNVIGYKVHYGTSKGNYQHSVDVKNNVSCSISGLEEGRTYFFAATAYNDKNMDSDYSAELAYSIPNPPPPVDTDGDGLLDSDETGIYGTDPAKVDTDGDGMKDGDEVAFWADDWDGDSDNDGLINILDQDSDNDGYADGSTPPAPPENPDEVIIDNGDEGTASTGIWGVSSRPNAYGANSIYSWGIGVHYAYETSVDGAYIISLWWTDHPTMRCKNVPVEIYDGKTMLDTVFINQQIDGGQWNKIGKYEFNGTPRVMVVSEGDCSTAADAVKFSRNAASPPAPAPVDSDGDGLLDSDETGIYGTDPSNADTDGDGMNDGDEVAFWGDNWNGDADEDGLINILDRDSDNDGYADGSSPPAPQNYDEIIIDNDAEGATSYGRWEVSSRPNAYGDNSVFSWSKGGYYAYEASINGTSSVSLWWTDHPTMRCNQVPVEIYDGSALLDKVFVNQQANGGQWNTLGTYKFNGKARVVVISEGNLSTSADAVQFLTVDISPNPAEPPPSEPAEYVIDNAATGTTSYGIWEVSSRPNAYGDNSVYSWNKGGYFAYEASISGTSTVSLWWTDHPTMRCNHVPVEIYDGDILLDRVFVNQQTNGGKWNKLGTYEFSGTARVVVISEGDLSTSADAVQFLTSLP